MQEDIDFTVVEISRLIWPASLRLPRGRFRLFIAADTTHCTTEEISEFAKAIFGRGMVYFCAWGPGCERFHDIVDEVDAKDDLGERKFAPPSTHDVVMTTWHSQETLEEALDFFATCAVPTEGYAENSRHRVVVSLANPEWASIAREFLKQTDFFA
jgi:hypothetical protein